MPSIHQLIRHVLYSHICHESGGEVSVAAELDEAELTPELAAQGGRSDHPTLEVGCRD